MQEQDSPMAASDVASGIERRVAQLVDRGVVVVDPRQTYVSADVPLDQVEAGVVLHPGTRLEGARTVLVAGAEIGAEGPATLRDCALDRGARIASGFADGAVLLESANAGAAAHLRPGTLLEEHASTAHAVGLKQTILLSYVTLGSLINFCDVLMAGGTSRSDHSEVGSGFIHFNFTPFGARGDKATPSLVGDVPRGVLLRSPRIFLGGAGGLVGPNTVGYGSVTGAGSVVRRPVPEATMALEAQPELKRDFAFRALDGVRRAGPNVAFIAQLAALRVWYESVRIARAKLDGSSDLRLQVLAEARGVIDAALAERTARLAQFLEERGRAAPVFDFDAAIVSAPRELELELDRPGDHIEWVHSLSDDAVGAAEAWLRGIVERVIAQAPEEQRPRRSNSSRGGQ